MNTLKRLLALALVLATTAAWAVTPTSSLKVSMYDGTIQDASHLIELNAAGGMGLAVNLQDQTTPPLFIKANNVTGASTLTVATAVDDTSITVVDDTEFSVGDYIGIFSTAANRFYVGTVLTKPGAGVLTLDSWLDFEFAIGDTVGAGITDMSVNGSVTPVIFSIRGQDPGIDVTADITRIIISCTDGDAVDLTKFCGGPVLTKGVLMRRVDGSTQNIINWKSNLDIAGSMYDWLPLSAGVGQQGIDGFISRLTFGGQSKIGVVLRIAAGEEIQFIIQDDLTGITSFEIMVEGHVVQGFHWVGGIFFLVLLIYFPLKPQGRKGWC